MPVVDGRVWEDGEMTSWGQLRVCKSQAIRPHMQLDEGEGVRTDCVIKIEGSQALFPRRQRACPSEVGLLVDGIQAGVMPSP